MMKSITLCLLFSFYLSTALAGYSDGFITEGEYEFGVTWRSYNPPLVVDGGGADIIEVRDSGRLIVKSTSNPLSLYTFGGVYDIYLFNNSQLLYLDGVTELINVGSNATAILKGGSINWIKSMQQPIGWGPDGQPIGHINLYALPGWSYISNNPLIGIEGQWWDGSPFRIQFINHANYPPVWQNINVIIPEPATLMLLGLGGLLMRRIGRMRAIHS
ncbi:MAG: PEP-CTERM sorting domain-containing protein [Phycisphaerae bacterium]|mgnify:CR=1 FL=1|nr:PEP-CTERM sorting domain-containing protein [Phycisphaerae bacterium]